MRVFKKFNKLVDDYIQDMIAEMYYSMNSEELKRVGNFRVDIQELYGHDVTLKGI